MDTEILLDQPRRLRYDLAAIKALEEGLGGLAIGLVSVRLRQLNVTVISLALWVGLRHEDKTLTHRQSDAILEAYLLAGGTFAIVTKALGDALDASGLFADPEKNAPADPRTPPS